MSASADPVSTAPPAVELHDVVKTYKGRRVLDAVSLTVHPGEIFALLGPNGAGKTTTINILTTLTSPDAGLARVAGFDVSRRRADVTRRIALTGQSAAVDDVLTGRENLLMLARLRGLRGSAAATRADELLARFDLVEAGGTRVRTYSGGMRRRLDLALSFVATPQVLFLDEPTTGLDTRSRREVWDMVRSLTGAGVTVLLTTQYLEEADLLADRIAVLDHGRIVAEGTPRELKARISGATVHLHDPHGVVIAEQATDGSADGIRAALDRWHREGLVGDVTLRRPTLDDVFLDLTTRHQKELA